MKSLLQASAIILVLAVPGAAAAQTADWSGPYFGGRLGYAGPTKGKNETILFDNDLNGTFGDTVNTSGGANAFSGGFCGGAAPGPRTTNCSDKNGTEWSVHVGYDYQLSGSLVAGVVAEYGRSTVVDSVSAFSSTPASYTLSRRLRDNASIRARAGFALGSTLIYGTGGVAYGKIQHSFSTSNSVNTFTQGNSRKNAWGYRAGGGIEQRISSRFSIGAQYLYTSLKDDDFTVRAGGANVPVSNPFILKNASGTDLRRSSRRFNENNVSVVVNFRF